MTWAELQVVTFTTGMLDVELVAVVYVYVDADHVQAAALVELVKFPAEADVQDVAVEAGSSFSASVSDVAFSSLSAPFSSLSIAAGVVFFLATS